MARVELVQERRRFPFLDPRPVARLPTTLRGRRAAAAFHDRHARWHRGRQRAWEAMVARAGARSGAVTVRGSGRSA